MQDPCGVALPLFREEDGGDGSDSRLWSLWRIMRVFESQKVGFILYLLKNDYDECRTRRKAAPVSSAEADAKRAIFYRAVMKHFSQAQVICARVGLVSAREQLRSIHYHYGLSDEPTSDYSTLCADLRRTIDSMFDDLRKRVFLEVKPEQITFLGNRCLLGQTVSDAFPSAVPDIVEAGNCLAADCSTAAVFHLMRVAEYGLRALAHDRRIKLDKNKPIDLATWEDLLVKLEDAEDAIRKLPKTAAREAQFDFFHGAGMELRRFKNKFRNRIMHARESYDWHEAMSAFDHVKAFMEVLSSRISERSRTPIIWKGAIWIKTP